MEKDESEESKRIVDIAIEGVAAENIQRYGAGVKEYCVAYSGIDNEAGKLLTKSLKGISEEKFNPKYKSINIKQQAGFSAEVLEVADANVNNIITGSPNRKIRTDDLSPTVDPVSGKTIGGINDELFDHVELDAKGNIVPESAAQMKFVGKDPEACFDKLMSNKYQKYHDANAKIEVPSDYYDGVLKAADRKIEKLQKSLNREEVQIGMSKDSKITSLSGEGTFTIKKVYSRGKKKILEAWNKGKDPRSTFVCKLKDPDTPKGQSERVTIDNVWFNELLLQQFEQGTPCEEEYSFGFTPSDASFVDEIKA